MGCNPAHQNGHEYLQACFQHFKCIFRDIRAHFGMEGGTLDGCEPIVILYGSGARCNDVRGK